MTDADRGEGPTGGMAALQPLRASDAEPATASTSGMEERRYHPRQSAPRTSCPKKDPIKETQLAAIWRGRRFPPGALVTRQGVPVTVIFQGREGRGPGPDFRGAVIAGPSQLPVRGDVELHVRSSSFRAHGHDLDPAYARVVLHVVFEDDTGEDTPLPGGRVAPVIALAPWVAARAGELERWLAQPLLWREPCHDAVMRMGAEGAGAALDAEGDRRFEEKVGRMSGRIAEAGLEQALYEGLLSGLGYGGNGPAMLALARLLPWARVAALPPEGRGGEAATERDGEPASRARGAHALTIEEAALLGSAGLLPSQRRHCGPLEPHVEALERAFAAMRLPSLSPSLWKLWGMRPANFPTRRIAAAAAFLARSGVPSSLLALARAGTVRELIAPLTVHADEYWRDITTSAPG